jgi:hypothetical protein
MLRRDKPKTTRKPKIINEKKLMKLADVQQQKFIYETERKQLIDRIVSGSKNVKAEQLKKFGINPLSMILGSIRNIK